MEQGHLSSLPNIFGYHLGAALICGDGAGGLVHDDVGPQPVHLVLGAYVGDQVQHVTADVDLGQQRLATQDPLPFRTFGVLPQVHESVGVGLVGDAPPHHLAPLLGGKGAVYFHRQAEPVQQLRAQVPLFGVHGSHKDELGGVANGYSFPFNVIAPHGGGVQQHVHQVVVEQIYLVDIEDAPMGGGDQPGLEAASAGLDGLLDVQGANQAVFGGTHG